MYYRLIVGKSCSPIHHWLQSSDLCIWSITSHFSLSSDFKVCSFHEGSCEVRYTIGTDLRGDEDTFHVVMDDGQSSVSTLRQGNSDCIPRQEIWPIFVGIILGIIVVGLLAVILWRCCTYIGVSLHGFLWKKLNLVLLCKNVVVKWTYGWQCQFCIVRANLGSLPWMYILLCILNHTKLIKSMAKKKQDCLHDIPITPIIIAQ